MEVSGYFIIIGVLLIFFAVQSAMSKKAKRERMEKLLRETFGKRPDREYKYDEYERIRFYFDSMSQGNGSNAVDDITWNDLSMDNIFKLINNTHSSVGEEYLYNILRTINFDDDKLNEFDALSEYFLNNPDKAQQLQYIYMELGRTRSVSFFDFIHRLKDLGRRSNVMNYICVALAAGAAATFFVNPALAVFVLIAVFSFNIFMYYREKGEVGNYFVCCKYLVGLVECAGKIDAMNISALEPYGRRIRELTAELRYLTRNMYLISDGTMNDSIAGIFMEYIKMLFHVDLIKFNSIVKATEDKIDSIDELYAIAGRIEAVIAVASLKKLLIDEYGAYTKPEIIRHRSNTERASVSFKELFHPMIEGAVKNSMNSECAILLTGSNASGKSTFLKTVAVNGILAQTIGLACADEFVMNESLIYSSMALRDDLMSSESYYIVEIKSLKRILDMAEYGGKNIMCFIDEVLRGTNTVERIAASSVILERLAGMNTICFAATHDIELTRLLDSVYVNYHFEEEVVEDDVLFNYRLKTGPATTRNAIKLLRVIGYGRDITEGASERAAGFLESGVWG